MELGIRSMSLDGIVVNRYSKMCFPVGVEMKKEPLHPAESGRTFVYAAEQAREIVSNVNSEAIFADGFDDAIMGYGSNGAAVYDYDKCCHILMDTSDMDESEANEYMQFNVVGAYVGDFTPIFIHTFVAIDDFHLLQP